MKPTVAVRKPTSQFDIREKESVSRLFQLSSLDKQETWYPTLQKTVWVLSQLHDFVKVMLLYTMQFPWLTCHSSLRYLRTLLRKP